MVTTDPLPDFTGEDDARRVVDLGDGMRMLCFRSTETESQGWGFAHRCDRGERGVILCAPRLRPVAHRIESVDPLTVSPSILCPDCGTHGFVRDGRWLEA